jgi:phage shock protein PspC (stress-responsive transcriptional regulator)
MQTGDRFCPTCGVAAPGATHGAWRSQYARPLAGRKIAGVCAGIARHNHWDVTMVRVAFLAALLLHGVGLVAYVIAWIAMPSEEYLGAPAH